MRSPQPSSHVVVLGLILRFLRRVLVEVQCIEWELVKEFETYVRVVLFAPLEKPDDRVGIRGWMIHVIKYAL